MQNLIVKNISISSFQLSQTVLIKTIPFSISIVFVYAQLNDKTDLFRTIHFNVVQFQCQKQFYFKLFRFAKIRRLNVKTVLFEIIYFSLSTQISSI